MTPASFKILGALLVASTPVVAQTADPSSFSIPSGALFCQYMPITANDSALSVSVSLRFIEGLTQMADRQHRTIEAGFDRQGDAVYLRMVPKAQRTVSAHSPEPIVVVFRGTKAKLPDGRTVGPASITPSARSSGWSLRTNGEYLPVAPADRAAALRLAQWLWSHRCPPLRGTGQ
jgi:hypothetical protein